MVAKQFEPRRRAREIGGRVAEVALEQGLGVRHGTASRKLNELKELNGLNRQRPSMSNHRNTGGTFADSAFFAARKIWRLVASAQSQPLKKIPIPKSAQRTTTNISPNRDRKSTRLNSSHIPLSRMPSSA